MSYFSKHFICSVCSVFNSVVDKLVSKSPHGLTHSASDDLFVHACVCMRICVCVCLKQFVDLWW